MTRAAALALCAVLAAPAAAAPAPAKKAAARRPVSRLNTTSGTIVKIELGQGHVTLRDGAGHLEDLAATKASRLIRLGRRARLKDLRVGDYATKAVYEPGTKRVLRMTVAPAAKAAPAAKDRDDAGRADAQGEVAGTDVIGGSISVRMGGGATMSFKVGDATKIVREAPDAPTRAIPLEAVKVGDAVEVRTKDWKTADEIHVRSPAK